jgi:translation initiation factor 2B subunit (eIF-2B alpha/beta/delta family)
MARMMIPAQPAMASVVNLFNHIFNRLDRARDQSPVALSASAAAQEFAAGMANHTDKISAHISALVRNGNVVLTHSASQTVREGLNACWKEGKQFSVICTESRPMREGAALARDFAAKGIPTCLVTDAQAFALLRGEAEFRGKVGMILVGADSVSPAGVTNKTGTLAFGLAARSWSIPFYVLGGSEKFLPPAYPARRAIQQKPAYEILSSPPPGLSIINRYFDITPLAYITAMITERGLISPRKLASALAKLTLHPLLQKLLRETL